MEPRRDAGEKQKISVTLSLDSVASMEPRRDAGEKDGIKLNITGKLWLQWSPGVMPGKRTQKMES